MERRSRKRWLWRGISLVCALGTALAQTPMAPPPSQAPAQPLPPRQLDNLVAPIALYPDPLLGQVLAASTYPLELVQAQQWLRANGNLHGQQLMDAARQQDWDASVQALVAMPDVLNRLTGDIRWTTDLGNAFLAQQSDVMAAVQRMRVRAEANGKLQSGPQETVTTEDQGGQSAVVIQPADPQVIYVPAYDPYYIWGPPVWGYYPPIWYPAYGFGWGPGINIGLWFGGWSGWGFGLGGFGWGWGLNWFGHGLFVNAGFFNHYGYHYGYGFAGGGFGGGVGLRAGMTAWAHDPSHRLGVGYPNSQLNSRYGAASQASRTAQTARSAAASGGWQRFSQAGNANSFRGGAAQAGVRGSQASPGWQRFQGRQTYQGPAQRSQSPAQRYQVPAQRYQAPAQRSYQSAPSYSGGGSRSYSGGGGGARSFGGGGGGFHGGGGGGGHGGGGHR